MTVVTGQDMLVLVTKRLNEMIAENEIKEGMKGKRLTITKAEVTTTFTQENSDLWSCYDEERNDDETDTDCGGSCTNKCMMLAKCGSDADCVEGLYCTRNKCIDRSRHWLVVYESL